MRRVGAEEHLSRCWVGSKHVLIIDDFAIDFLLR